MIAPLFAAAMAVLAPALVAQADDEKFTMTVINGNPAEWIWVTPSCLRSSVKYYQPSGSGTYQIGGSAQAVFSDCFDGGARSLLIEDQFNNYQNERRCWLYKNGPTLAVYDKETKNMTCTVSGTYPNLTINVSF